MIENVQSCFYGERDLAPTGPMLFGKILQNYPKLVLEAHCHDEMVHIGDPELIHNKFPGYRAVYARMGYDKDRRSYGHLWNARRCTGTATETTSHITELNYLDRAFSAF